MHNNALSLFIIQALIILGSSRLLGKLASWIRQPMVVAEVVAGILLGPSLLGFLAPDFSSWLFPTGKLEGLHLLSQVGLILFMFLIGLELDPRLLKGQGRAAMFISNTSIIFPFLLGGGLATLIYPTMAPAGVPTLSFQLFMGAAMSITAFPVLARILAERRLLQSRVGALTITCAAMNDVTAWCILAFLVAIVKSSGVSTAIITTLLTLAYMLVMWFVVRPFLARLGKRAGTQEGLTQNVVALTFILIFISALATEYIGIHALFGAFLVGAIMPREEGFTRILGEKLEDLVMVLLLPLFFAFSGLRTSIGLISTPSDWVMTGVIILVACVGKWAGSAIAARLTGFNTRESAALGVLMNTRGLMELIVLNIGLDLGVLSPKLFTMMVLMALVTTFMTTPLLQWVYPVEELAKVLAVQQKETQTRLPRNTFTVLLCVAYDRSGPGLLQLASAMLGESNEGRIYALKLVQPTDRTSFYFKPDQEEEAVSTLRPLVTLAEVMGVQLKPLTFVSSNPADDICNVASVKGANLVLMGWHKPLLGQSLLGGTVHEVMREARADVAVWIDRGMSRAERVLVPFIGAPDDESALELSARFAEGSGSQVTILFVGNPESPAEEGLAKEALERLVKRLFPQKASKPDVIALLHADAAQAVVEEAARGYSLVIVGVGTEWGIAHRAFGVTPDYLLENCPVSLLVVRRFVADRSES